MSKKDLIGLLLVSYGILNQVFGNGFDSASMFITCILSIVVGCVVLNFESDKSSDKSNG